VKCSAYADFSFFEQGFVTMLAFRPFAFAAARRPAASSLGRFGRTALRSFASAEVPEPPAAGAAGAAAPGAAPAAPETPESTIAALNQKVAELKDHLLRQMAETENVR
jgi:hypothetical protein